MRIEDTEEESCFTKGTLVVVKNASGTENRKIEDVNEGELVLCQDKQGRPVFEPVIVKDVHNDYRGKLIQFTLDNGNEVTVTSNHGMLVDGHIVFAHSVQAGMKFAVHKDNGYEEANIVEKREVTMDNKGTTVYNLVVPNYNIAVNNILASCKGEDGVKNYPAFAWTMGEWIYNFGGAKLARKFYRVFQQ